SGTLTFKGLKEGTYTIYEIKAPDGYNLLENPIEVVLQWQASVNGVDCVWSINGDSSINGITVKNYSGTTLPSTGGIGTSLFYLSGLVLVGIGLYLTRRKENEN
ncbi:MAG: SpaA isopeptide-forming pilin-related protein, partial [Traorella sp.]